MGICLDTSNLENVSKTTAPKKLHMPFRRIFDFGLIWAILRRFLPNCIVFSPITTVTSCQDADFFPAMRYLCFKVIQS